MFSKKSSTSQVARLHISLLIASFLIYLGGQIWQCVSWPPFYSFDETLEIDYVYQLSQGHLLRSSEALSSIHWIYNIHTTCNGDISIHHCFILCKFRLFF